MRNKSAIIALAAVFLLQTQAFAAIENESEILGGNAKRSVPAKQSGQNSNSGGFSLEGSDEPETVSEADRQREILSTNARRSVKTQTEKDKGNSSSKNKRVRNGVIIEDKKNSSETRIKVETKNRNKEDRARVLEESRVISASDWQREILSGNAKRSVNVKRQGDDRTVERKSKQGSKVIRNGVIIEPKKTKSVAGQSQTPDIGQDRKQNSWPSLDWQREILSNNAKTSLPVQRDDSGANKVEIAPSEVVRNGVVLENTVTGEVAEQPAAVKAPVLPREHIMLAAPIQAEKSADEGRGNTKRVERNGVVFILKDETPSTAKEDSTATEEAPKDAAAEKDTAEKKDKTSA